MTPPWRDVVTADRIAVAAINRLQEIVVPILIACFPLSWLAFFNKTFYTDWNRHLWMLAYTGEYFRHHFWFPPTFNTREVIGITYPPFYGTLFYPIAGMLSAVTGAAIAMRLIALAVFSLQAVQVTKLVRSVYPGRSVAWSVAAIVSCAVYPLTNLYNRNAILEFMAASMLVSACALWLRAMIAPHHRAALVRASSAWMLLALSAGAHPITAVLGGVFFSALLVGGFIGAVGRRAFVVRTVCLAVLFLLVLSPWLYATVKFQGDMWIAGSLTSVRVWVDSFDAWWIRLLPFPFDIRPLKADRLFDVSTPYLDAQINFGLLTLVCFLVFQVWSRIRRHQMTLTSEVSAAGACLIIFALVLYGSVSPGVWKHLPSSFGFFQFACRLVNYCDLSLLLAAVALLSALRPYHAELRVPLSICLTASVVLMGQGVLVKFSHVAAIQRDGVLPGIGISGERDALLNLAATLPWADFSVTTGLAGVLPDAPTVKLVPMGGRHFGKAQPVVISPQAVVLTTNVQAFPWNRIILDGRELSPAETFTTQRFLSFKLEPGDLSFPHLVGYRFAPDRLYTVLRVTSGVVLVGWAAGLLVLVWRGRRRFFRPVIRTVGE